MRELLASPVAPALEQPPVVADDDGELPWWEATAGAPDEVAALLDEADQLAAAGDFAGAETAYAAAERAIPRQPPPDAPPTRVPWEDEAIDGFLGLFAAGQERCDIAPDRVRERFETLGQPPGTAQARDHLDGNIALAVRPLLADGTTTLGVVDVDARAPAAAVASAAHAGALASVVRAWRIEGLLETTGGRGHHLWIPVDGRMPADTMASFLDHLCRTAGTPPAGVTVERLPAGAGSPDLHAQTITLPLGLHAETGVPSSLAWLDGPAVVADGAGGIAGLFARRPSTPEAIAAHAAGATSPGAVEADPPAGSTAADAGLVRLGRPIERVLAGCVLLRHLEAKAAASGHLSHAERLSLLYSLGHVAEGGQRAIHAIIGRCANYDPAETDRQIAKLTGLPIGCTRLREKHATPELLPQCNCDFGDVRRRGGYPTPLLHAAGFRRSWRDVLRGRREGAVAVRERHQREPAAVAIPVATPHDVEVDGGRDLDADRDIALATPPHEWA